MASGVKRILVAPLDWGLGHSRRCVPLIQYLQGLGHKVVVAGNDWQRRFIKGSFPGIETIDLPGYNISYSKSGSGFVFAMFRQMPRLLAAIRQENDWLIEQTARQGFDGIISDNRYGLFHKKIPSVIMTHQLSVRTGLGQVADDMLRRLHYKYLQRFSKCWVVDVASRESMAGNLSHPKVPPVNAAYIGLLSQFEVREERGGEHLLVLLSGPEPQRTLLSQMLWEQVLGSKAKVVFVEGSNNSQRPANIPEHISWYGKVTRKDLQPLLQNASMVVCRSGYSTLMDLVAMNKKAIVVPTPGQTEQKYLAKHLHREGVFFACPQRNFDLKKVLDNAKLFPFKELALHHAFDDHKAIIDSWLKTL